MTQETLEVVVGAVLPPFIQVINSRVKDASVRYLISIAICLGISVVSNVLLGTIALVDILGSGALIFASAQTTYRLYFTSTDSGRKLMSGK